MSKRALFLLFAVLTVLTASVTGTLAFLNGTVQDADVMTEGRVFIEQNQYERDADGKLVTVGQERVLYPAMYSGDVIPLDSDSANWPMQNDPAWQTLDSTGSAGVVDQFITVTNTGNRAAYVRTIVALECPASGVVSATGVPWIRVHHNTADDQAIQQVDEVGIVTVADVDYHAYVYTYQRPLAKGETTVPSLKQLYMDKNCSSIHVEALGETYQVLALSQAVQQTDKFSDAVDALDTAFGEPTADHLAKWLLAVVTDDGSGEEDPGEGGNGGDDTGDGEGTGNEGDNGEGGGQPQEPQPVAVSNMTELEEALAKVETGSTVVVQLAPGTYKKPAKATGKTITLKGGEGVILEMGTDSLGIGPSDFSFADSALRLENIQVKAASSGRSEGFACRSMEMVDCTISGKMTLFAPATFTNCRFTTTSNMIYSIEINGQNTTFTGCTFTVVGKAVLVNNPGDQPCKVTAVNCLLTDKTKGSYQAAFDVESSDNAVAYTLVFENCTVTGFKQGTQGVPTNTALWSNNKSIPKTLLNVTVDGTQVY